METNLILLINMNLHLFPLLSILTRELELELEFFIVHKEANFDLWDHSIHVFLIYVSFLSKGVHTLKHKVSMC